MRACMYKYHIENSDTISYKLPTINYCKLHKSFDLDYTCICMSTLYKVSQPGMERRQLTIAPKIGKYTCSLFSNLKGVTFINWKKSDVLDKKLCLLVELSWTKKKVLCVHMAWSENRRSREINKNSIFSIINRMVL